MVRIGESEVHPFKKSAGVNTINMYIFKRSKAKGALPPLLPVLPFLAPNRDTKLFFNCFNAVRPVLMKAYIF